MDFWSHLVTGFGIALSPTNLLFAFVGCVIGTMIGVLPGIGSVATVALLMPISFGMDPTTGLIMMAGVYYGAMYGGSTTSILVRTPGESNAVVTTLDGYPMAQQGRAGAALATAAIGSFIAGTFSTAGLMLFAPVLSSLALRFGPAEYFVVMVLGLTSVSSLTTGSTPKALASMFFGLALATVGQDMSGWARFTFGLPEFIEGIDLLVVAIGLFAISEALWSVADWRREPFEKTALEGRVWLSREDWRRSVGPWLRGTVIGFLVGLLPGAGATISAFLSYSVEKRLAKRPEEFGKGAIEGVAGPEAANNASVGGAMVPLMTLGIPGSGTTAVLLAAFLMFGLQPGPLLFERHADFAWALIASMYIGNIMLLILNLPLIRVFVKMLDIRPALLFPLILVFSLIGVYGVTGSVFQVFLAIAFGVLGYLMRRYNVPAAPAVLGLVLGPGMELNFRRALALSQGDAAIFWSSDVIKVLWLLVLLSLLGPQLQVLGRRRRRPASRVPA